MSVHGLGGKFSEKARRALMAMPGADLARWGLVGTPPADALGHQIRPGLSVPMWPPRYVTGDVMRIVNLFDLAALGMPPRTDGAIHWPPPLVQAFVRIAAERKVPRE